MGGGEQVYLLHHAARPCQLCLGPAGLVGAGSILPLWAHFTQARMSSQLTFAAEAQVPGSSNHFPLQMQKG